MAGEFGLITQLLVGSFDQYKAGELGRDKESWVTTYYDALEYPKIDSNCIQRELT